MSRGGAHAATFVSVSVPSPALKVFVTFAAATSSTEIVPSPWFAASAVLASGVNVIPTGDYNVRPERSDT
ncbi:MAG TPA: hypothetical protein VMV37_01910 [Gammaproteobacteria bacterium]|nr:hypothetical protein [Gammaproteobacteria bacterium]